MAQLLTSELVHTTVACFDWIQAEVGKERLASEEFFRSLGLDFSDATALEYKTLIEETIPHRHQAIDDWFGFVMPPSTYELGKPLIEGATILEIPFPLGAARTVSKIAPALQDIIAQILARETLAGTIEELGVVRLSLAVRETTLAEETAAMQKVDAVAQGKPISALEPTAFQDFYALKASTDAYHIMQEKHGWDAVLELTGNVQVDFQAVKQFLEENKICRTKNLERAPRVFSANGQGSTPTHCRVDYKMEIQGKTVRAVFIQDLETGEVVLNDAWIIKQK